jgi:hypothetical protein
MICSDYNYWPLLESTGSLEPPSVLPTTAWEEVRNKQPIAVTSGA